MNSEKDFMIDSDDSTEINIPELVEKLKEASEQYYGGDFESSISDEEFDHLKDILKSVDPNNKFLYQIGSPVSNKVSEWKKATHKIPMGSLNKVNTIDEWKTWCKQVDCDDFILSCKLDGISIDLEYEKGKLIKAITRGDGIIGEDIFSNVVNMKNVIEHVNKGFTGSIRGEIVIHKDDFIKLNEESEKNGDRVYKNLRNSAGGISKNFEGKYSKYCTVLYYDITGDFTYENNKFVKLGSFDLLTTWYMDCNQKEVEEQFNKWEKTFREEYPYEIDGLCVYVNDIEKSKQLGFAYDNPKGKVALKFGNIKKETNALDVSWQVGNNRRISPVLKVKPIKVGGVTIENVSLANVGLFLKYKLGLNDRIIISRANDVIPFFENVIEHVGKKFKVPEKCPVCDQEVELNGKYLECNNDNCPALHCGNLFKWIDKLDVMDISYATIETLYNAGLVVHPEDFYHLSEKEFASLNGLGEKSAKKFLDQLHSKMEIELPTFIGGLNMSSFSTSICEKLINAGFDTLDKLFELNVETLCKIPGIKEKIAGKIIKGLREKKEVIEKLLKIGIKIKSEDRGVNKMSNKFDMISFCFTGGIEKENPSTGKKYKREELQKIVVENGGINHTSVKKGTTFLVQTKADSMTTKSQKAIELGTKILSEADFFKMLEG